MSEIRKMIIVECCDGCPFSGMCKPWKALTSQQKVKLMLSTGLGKFILKGCPLPDGEEGAKPFGRIEDAK